MVQEKALATVYVVRHGETDWNIKGVIQGHTDIPLNSKGKTQAKNLSAKLKDVFFDAVFSSDLMRAKETAEIVALEKKIAVQATQLLRERNFGTLEGKSAVLLDQLRKDIAYLSDEEKYTYRLQADIENDEEVISRFITYIREIAIGYPNKNILMVTHGGMLRMLLLHLGIFSYEKPEFGRIGNTAYIVLQCDGVDFFVKELVEITLPERTNGKATSA